MLARMIMIFENAQMQERSKNHRPYLLSLGAAYFAMLLVVDI
jgi:hypothetical protein